MRLIKVILILTIAMTAVQCKDIRREYHWFMDMAYSPDVDSQQVDDLNVDADGNPALGNRSAPAGTISRKALNSLYERTVPGVYEVDQSDPYTIIYKINGETVDISADSHARFAKMIKNPLKANEKNLARGEQRFQIYCGPCHGLEGKADGTVAAVWEGARIPAFVGSGAASRNWSTEQFFLVMTTGINSMQSYASQIPEKDRWAIALYIKRLQAKAGR